MAGNYAKQLEDYFQNTSQEQLDKDFEELQEWNDVGPRVEKQIKTFRDLKEGDEIIVKNIQAYIGCNVTIEGHTYVNEVKYHDEKFWITHFSHFDNSLNGHLLEFFATNGIRQYRFVLDKNDYDEIETDKFKIIQE